MLHRLIISKFYPHTIIFPLLSPETKDSLSLFFINPKADTDPVCPETALTHFFSYQK